MRDEIHLGIDEHSFRHQDLVYTVTWKLQNQEMLGVLRDDPDSYFRSFLSNIPKDKVEVCIDLKQSLKKLWKICFLRLK